VRFRYGVADSSARYVKVAAMRIGSPSARSARRIAWLALGSLLVHAAVLWLLPVRVTAPPASAPSPPLVMFESAELAPPSEAATSASPSMTHEPAVARARRAPQASASVPIPAPHALPNATPALADVPPTQPAPRMPLDLSPRAAALSALPALNDAREQPVARTADDLARDRSAELSASLHAAARAEVDRLQQPSLKLELRREPDGTCHYDGRAITATILADGGVVFDDKGAEATTRWGVDEPAERVVTPDDAVAPQQLALGLRVQGRAWDAERTWFLRQTEDIRRELADAARERELRAADRDLRAADRDLRAQLDRIWCDASRTKAERRRSIHTIWASMSADEDGERGRAVVIGYVRRNLPAGSADAYTPDELAKLAAFSGRGFDPYADDVARIEDAQPSAGH
jgi:hypothetical protein